MKKQTSRRFVSLLTGSVFLVSLGACAGTGSGAGSETLPFSFQDDGGIADPYPSSFAGQYLAGRQAFREKNSEEAAKYFDQVLEQYPEDGFILQNTFQVALANGDMEKALLLARDITAQNANDDGAARLILAIDEIRSRNFLKAGEHLSKTRAAGFNILIRPVLGAWVKLGQGQKEAAYKALDELDNYDGFKALKSYHLALLAHVSGDREEAQKQFEAAYSGPAGRAVRFVQSYGRFLMEQSDKEAALKIISDYQKQFPLSPTANRLLEDLTKNNNVEPVLNNPIDGAAEALYSSATIVSQERVRSVAATYAYFSLMLRPDLVEAKALLAEIAEDEQKWEKALSFYQAIPEGSPYTLNARIRSAWIAHRLGETDRAVSRLERLAKDNPDNIEPLVVLADLNRDVKNWRRAASAYGRAIDNIGEAKSRLWSLLYARGIAFERLNEWNNAEADLVKALELRPDHPQILNYLGYSWADRGENLEEARKMLTKAVSLRPRDGYIVDSLGWLYYRIGDYENAALQLEKAVALQPEDPTINDHLGDAYWQVGRYKEARYQWQRSLWLDPEEKLIPIIEDKLKNGLPKGNGTGQ
ncbi:tetratricopeptide repeat protein [Sneathiella aquimaris]|uniref:tetratricopeptide repeat protein n=1 Tax=Sneathiella aquimaris TaxID=2599305 RepID=UPI00146D97E0|nr:tetratricopeptide repeat protein [Sneathiella aquimaris]